MIGFNRIRATFTQRFHTILQRAGETDPRRLALTFTAGVTIGLMPTPWGTMVICALVALLLKLNQLVIQGFNYLVYPLQILLMPFLILIGHRLFAPSATPLSIDALRQSLQSPSFELLSTLGQAFLHGLILWVCLVPLVAPLVYLTSRRMIHQLLASRSGTGSAGTASPVAASQPTNRLDL